MLAEASEAAFMRWKSMSSCAISGNRNGDGYVFADTTSDKVTITTRQL